MNYFFVSLFVMLVFLACVGWATFATYRHGPAAEKIFRASRAFMIAGLFLTLTFVANYWLASTALKRMVRAEKFGTDPILALFFSGSAMRSNQLLGLMFVVASFVAAGFFLKYLGEVFSAVSRQTWRQNSFEFGLLLAKFAIWTGIAFVFLWADTALLLFRSTQMMFPKDMAKTATLLPSPDLLLQQHSGTMGAYLLRVFMWWYPLYILLAEKHWASSWAALSAAIAEYHGQRAALQSRASVAPVAVPPAPIVPIPAGTIPVVPAAPIVAPVAAPDGIPVPPPPGNMPVPPAPGGAAPWVRPVPFNTGPQNLNGARNARQ